MKPETAVLAVCSFGFGVLVAQTAADLTATPCGKPATHPAGIATPEHRTRLPLTHPLEYVGPWVKSCADFEPCVTVRLTD